MAKKIEFIVICALLMSSVAMSIDIMLPSLGKIAIAFRVEQGNDRQLIIVVLFIGFTIGQLIFGPCSDATGRKPMVLIGLAIFCVGSMVCAFASSFDILLAGRAIQGFGAAGPRIVTMAMIRDRFEGPQMAQIISIVIGIFIFVPMLAPSVGQALLFLMPWRGLFVFLAFIGLFGGAWLALRLEETLQKQNPLSRQTYLNALGQILKSPICMAYTIAGALCYGALMGHVNTSQQLLQDVYQTGDQYALWFGASAAFISAATFINVRLVKIYRMEFLCLVAVGTLVIWTIIFGLHFQGYGYNPSIMAWMIFNCVSLFLLGLTFGNFNTIALKKFGHMAGMASATVTTINSAIGLIIAWLVGRAFNGTVSSVMSGYALCGIAAFLVILTLDQTKPWQMALELKNKK